MHPALQMAIAVGAAIGFVVFLKILFAERKPKPTPSDEDFQRWEEKRAQERETRNTYRAKPSSAPAPKLRVTASVPAGRGSAQDPEDDTSAVMAAVLLDSGPAHTHHTPESAPSHAPHHDPAPSHSPSYDHSHSTPSYDSHSHSSHDSGSSYSHDSGSSYSHDSGGGYDSGGGGFDGGSHGH